jgi:ABC-type Fe3+ transport system substrate-binding protein
MLARLKAAVVGFAILASVTIVFAAEDGDTILAKAKEEKILVLYSSADLRDGTALVHAFQRKFAFIEPRLFRVGSSQIPVRVLQEQRAGANLVDVIQSGDFVFYELSRASIFQPYDSPERRAFPDTFKDKEGFWTSAYHNAAVIAFNTNNVKEADVPKTYDDLLHPKWKGKMILDVNGPEWYAGMLQVLGREKGMSFMRDLAKQNLHFSNGKVLANQILISGEYSLLVNNYEHLVQSARRRGAPIQSIPAYPVLSRVSTIALARQAPHPNVGRLYIDFVLSEEGQKILRSFGRGSSRNGLEPDELQRKGIKLVVTDMGLAKDFARYATEFKQIFGF